MGNRRPGYGPRGLGWFPMADKMSEGLETFLVDVTLCMCVVRREDATGLY